jgi:C4-dicarboxylate-specific signal transduction histidine kinase
VRKATEIISHLRTFGRAAPVSHDPVALNDVLERALSLMQEQLRLRQIEIDLRPFPPNTLVVGSSIQLEQACIHLLTNARDAVAETPRKVIAIHGAVCERTIILTFRDTGPGIPPGLEKRIFDPFFTTKDVGSGTGLGLSITYGIIKDHHGTIEVGNHPEGGAVFRVELPLAEVGAGVAEGSVAQ